MCEYEVNYKLKFSDSISQFIKAHNNVFITVPKKINFFFLFSSFKNNTAMQCIEWGHTNNRKSFRLSFKSTHISKKTEFRALQWVNISSTLPYHDKSLRPQKNAVDSRWSIDVKFHFLLITRVVRCCSFRVQQHIIIINSRVVDSNDEIWSNFERRSSVQIEFWVFNLALHIYHQCNRLLRWRFDSMRKKLSTLRSQEEQ